MTKEQTHGSPQQFDDALEAAVQQASIPACPMLDEQNLQTAQALVAGLAPLRYTSGDTRARVWRKVQARMVVQPPARRRLRLPSTRAGWAAFALVCAMPFATLVYATLHDLYQADAGLQFIERQDVGQQLNLSRATNGFTITLQRAHVDANRITIGGSITGAALTNDVDPWPRLLDTTGTVYPTSELYMTGVKDQKRAFVAAFDATAMTVAPEALQLVIEVQARNRPTDPLQESHSRTIAGPITFEFSVAATIDRRSIELQQTVTANGIAVTLGHVRVSRTAAYVDVCPQVRDSAVKAWGSEATLATGTGLADRIQSDTSITTTTPAGCHTARFFAPHYFERSGEWTLTVNELVEFHASSPEEQKRIAGPWVFHFKVPQP